MILHTVNAPHDSTALSDCLRIAGDGDAILLMGDAVYAALENTSACAGLRQSAANIFVLDADARAAGIVERLCAGATLADYDDFVALSERFAQQLAWY